MDRLRGCRSDFDDELTHEVWIQVMACAIHGLTKAQETKPGKEEEAKFIEDSYALVVINGPLDADTLLNLIMDLEPHLAARIMHARIELSHESN